MASAILLLGVDITKIVYVQLDNGEAFAVTKGTLGLSGGIVSWNDVNGAIYSVLQSHVIGVVSTSDISTQYICGIDSNKILTILMRNGMGFGQPLTHVTSNGIFINFLDSHGILNSVAIKDVMCITAVP